MASTLCLLYARAYQGGLKHGTAILCGIGIFQETAQLISGFSVAAKKL
ncbi:MAG TPA: hypothetical protein VMF89_07510 [Polyangiales bacterium]|nr:hypothetical protein [Polyangiales bacterium]